MRINLFTIIFVLFFAASVQAEIYTCKNAKGETIYTDSPSQCVNAEEVKVDTLPTLIPTKPISIPANNQNNQPEEEKFSYSILEITSPANNANLRDNQGNITINFRSTPALQTRKGHQYVVAVNGKDVYSGTSTITALKNVDRGTHTITAKIIDSSGKVIITSSAVKATLQRFSSLQNNNVINDSGGNGDAPDGSNTNSQAFPSNTKFPTRPPPASN